MSIRLTNIPVPGWVMMIGLALLIAPPLGALEVVDDGMTALRRSS